MGCSGDVKRSWQVRREAAHGHKCINENGVMHSDQEQESLRDEVMVEEGGGGFGLWCQQQSCGPAGVYWGRWWGCGRAKRQLGGSGTNRDGWSYIGSDTELRKCAIKNQLRQNQLVQCKYTAYNLCPSHYWRSRALKTAPLILKLHWFTSSGSYPHTHTCKYVFIWYSVLAFQHPSAVFARSFPASPFRGSRRVARKYIISF